MEEKLYFKPADYGKGRKKSRAEKADKDEPKTKKNHRVLKLASILFFLFVVIIIVLWLLRGKTTTTGQYPENVKNESLVCASTELTPSKLSYIDSDNKEIKVSAIFHGASELKTMSLVYKLEYDSSDSAYAAEAKGHAKFNESLYASGYTVDKFSNKFARYGGTLSISLHILKNEIDEISAPYFMINVDEDKKVTLRTISDYQQNYEAQGFTCNSTI